MSGSKYKEWVFEGDFKACFDTLNHDFIMRQIGGFPEAELIAKWLKAGFMDNSVFNATEEGTPQGGIISPLLANIALHGMESALDIKYTMQRQGQELIHTNKAKYTVCKYADDFVIMCKTKEEAEGVYLKLADYLAERGLTLSEEKTKITHILDGFDFLGFNIRRYKVHDGVKMLIKPSKSNINSIKAKIAEIFKNSYGNNAQNLISKLNPVIIGTANYWCHQVAKETYSAMDCYIWQKLSIYLRRSHPKKNWEWIKKRYFKPDKTGQSRGRWILTDPDTGNQLKRMSWTPIIRHVKIKHDYSPFDKDLKEYFEKRDIKEFNLNSVAYRQKLAKTQKHKNTFVLYVE